MEIFAYCHLQPLRLPELLPEFRRQPPHLLLERLAIIHDILGAHVPPGCQHETILPDLLNRCTLAETRHIHIRSGFLLAPPCVIRGGNPNNVLIGEIAMHPVDQRPHLPGVDEQRLAATVAEPVVLLVPGHEPEADRDLGGVEELSRHGDHAVHEISLNDVLPYLALTGLVRGHGAVREHEARDAGRCEVIDEVLHPCKVRVAGRGEAILPAGILFEPLAAPVT